MKGQAFCPAHITGFFKAEIDSQSLENTGSLGAGFSIEDGVTTTVSVSHNDSGCSVSTEGFHTDDVGVSRFVIGEFLKLHGSDCFVDVRHEVGVPVGYGLGCSGAAALSLALALNEALSTGLSREEAGRIAHVAEVSCRTGLGDVLASYHGGFEIRTGPGAPGVGSVDKIESSGLAGVIICLAPVSTTDFLKDRLPEINGIGGRMVDVLKKTRDVDGFQDMSLEFAGRINVVTPEMKKIVDRLHAGGIRCGVALFGQTVFSLVNAGEADVVLDAVAGCGAANIISSGIDQRGARLVQ